MSRPDVRKLAMGQVYVAAEHDVFYVDGKLTCKRVNVMETRTGDERLLGAAAFFRMCGAKVQTKEQLEAFFGDEAPHCLVYVNITPYLTARGVEYAHRVFSESNLCNDFVYNQLCEQTAFRASGTCT